MPKFKQIKLVPSEFILDVWIGKNSEILPKYNKVYVLSGVDAIQEADNWVDTIYFVPKGKIICMKVVSLNNKRIILHEIIHVLWHLAKEIGYKMTYDTQEWQAVLYEWLYVEILKNNYGELPD